MILKLTSVTQSVVWGPLKVFLHMESSKANMLPGQKEWGRHIQERLSSNCEQLIVKLGKDGRVPIGREYWKGKKGL
jgi:hypothetical protein